MTRIELHIDELVLHGFAPHGRARIGDAVERAIGDALAAHAATLTSHDGDADVDRVDAGAVSLPAQPSPAAVGSAVGAAVASAVAGVK